MAKSKVQPCGSCVKDVTSSNGAMMCEGLCELWYHIECVNMSDERYQELQLDTETKWRCPACEKEPLLSISRDIKYLQSVIFLISDKAPQSMLENISSNVKSFIYDLILKNGKYLEDVEDELCSKLGKTSFDIDFYHDKMNKFQKMDHNSIAPATLYEQSDPSIKNNLNSSYQSSNNLFKSKLCEQSVSSIKNNFKSSYESSKNYFGSSSKVQDVKEHDSQLVKKYPVDLEDKVTPGKLLEAMRYSLIISPRTDVFDETDICCKDIHSCDLNKSNLIRVGMENSKEIDETLIAASDGKTDIPNANQQAIAEENHQQSSSQQEMMPPQSTEVGNVATSISKPATGEQAANSGAGEYEVEDILDHMRVQDKTIFLVKWKNYGHESNSWESREDLTNCKLAINNYFRRSLTNYERERQEQGFK